MPSLLGTFLNRRYFVSGEPFYSPERVPVRGTGLGFLSASQQNQGNVTRLSSISRCHVDVCVCVYACAGFVFE